MFQELNRELDDKLLQKKNTVKPDSTVILVIICCKLPVQNPSDWFYLFILTQISSDLLNIWKVTLEMPSIQECTNQVIKLLTD